MIRSEGEYVERFFSIIPEILLEAGAGDWGLGDGFILSLIL
jgi:hypothetical protein